MRWLFPWRWFRRAPRKRRQRSRSPAAPARPNPPTTRPATRAPKELFLDEGAERPVDLSGGLEASAPAPDRGEELRGKLQGLRENADEVERKLLSEIERGIKSGGLQLPPMPQVILRVHRLIDSGLFNMEDLARGIELDPALATKMVGVANSPFYAGMEPAPSVRDAIVRVGMLETRNILMAIMLRSRVFRVPGFETLTQEMWEHALAASVTTRALAVHMRLDPDLGFLGGLVHDVGRGVVLSCAGDLRRRSRGRLQFDLALLERVNECLHPGLGAVVANSWNLGDELGTAIAYHHEPEAAPESAQNFARLLWGGDQLAKELCRRGQDDPPAGEELSPLIEPLGLTTELLDELMAGAVEEFEELSKVL